MFGTTVLHDTIALDLEAFLREHDIGKVETKYPNRDVPNHFHLGADGACTQKECARIATFLNDTYHLETDVDELAARIGTLTFGDVVTLVCNHSS